MRPDRGVPRLARTLVFALAALGLSAAGHWTGGGGAPSPAVLALVGPPVLLLSLWLSARQRGLPALFGVLSLVQAGLHVVYHLGHAAPSGPLRSLSAHAGPPGSSGHAGHAPTPGLPSVLPVLPAPSVSGHGVAAAHDGATLLTGLFPSPAMLLGHVAAVVLTAWIMARGEQAWWRVVHRLRVRLAPTMPVVLPRRVSSPVLTDLRVLASRWSGRVVATRGPPAPVLLP